MLCQRVFHELTFFVMFSKLAKFDAFTRAVNKRAIQDPVLSKVAGVKSKESEISITFQGQGRGGGGLIVVPFRG